MATLFDPATAPHFSPSDAALDGARKHNRALEDAARDTGKRAHALGTYLNEVKESGVIAHGDWEQFLSAAGIGQRRAQMCSQLARELTLAEAANKTMRQMLDMARERKQARQPKAKRVSLLPGKAKDADHAPPPRKTVREQLREERNKVEVLTSRHSTQQVQLGGAEAREKRNQVYIHRLKEENALLREAWLDGIIKMKRHGIEFEHVIIPEAIDPATETRQPMEIVS